MHRSEVGPDEYRTNPCETNPGHSHAPKVYPIRPRVETQLPNETVGELSAIDNPPSLPQTNPRLSWEQQVPPQHRNRRSHQINRRTAHRPRRRPPIIVSRPSRLHKHISRGLRRPILREQSQCVLPSRPQRPGSQSEAVDFSWRNMSLAAQNKHTNIVVRRRTLSH